LLRHLENQELEVVPSVEDPLDAVMVLGGGTIVGPHRAELGESGDRVLYAAQLYQSGRARQLITSGSETAGLFGIKASPAEQTTEIWVQLGIPRSAIRIVPGINTHQELESLSKIYPEFAGRRLGLLTSALHLPRAMRLARARGLDRVIPLAANHVAPTESLAVFEYLPSSSYLNQLSHCQHEILASLVNR
jgi:uncharacterized SAM-binding protein YcdF (DUF218 family)